MAAARTRKKVCRAEPEEHRLLLQLLLLPDPGGAAADRRHLSLVLLQWHELVERGAAEETDLCVLQGGYHVLVGLQMQGQAMSARAVYRVHEREMMALDQLGWDAELSCAIGESYGASA